MLTELPKALPPILLNNYMWKEYLVTSAQFSWYCDITLHYAL